MDQIYYSTIEIFLNLSSILLLIYLYMSLYFDSKFPLILILREERVQPQF